MVPRAQHRMVVGTPVGTRVGTSVGTPHDLDTPWVRSWGRSWVRAPGAIAVVTTPASDDGENARVRALVAAAPLLNREQAQRLALLFRPVWALAEVQAVKAAS